MVALALSAAGTAIGASAGLSAVGSTVLATAGALAGTYIENSILGVGNDGSQTTIQPFTSDDLLVSGYGKAIPLVYGTARCGGNVIWMSTPQTTDITHTQRVRTGKFSSKRVTTGTERYTEVNIAIALSAVPFFDPNEDQAVAAEDEENLLSYHNRKGIVAIRRLWADNALLYDARTFNTKTAQTNNFEFTKLYDGAESQAIDDTIESSAGIDNVPAFRGLSYIMLENLRISDFGNRVPNFSAEVVASLPRAVTGNSPEGLTEGKDGTIYTANHLARTITAFDANTLKTTATIGESNDFLGSLKAHPWRLTTGLDGDIWVTNKGDAMVQRIRNNVVIASIDVGNYPYDITTDLSGGIWVTHPVLDQISYIDPTDNSVNVHSVLGAPWCITTGVEGDLWITTNQQVVRYNIVTGQTVTIDVGLLPWGIAVNAVTAEIWVAISGHDYLMIIDSATNTVKKVRNTGTYPTDVSAHSQDVHGSVAVTLLYGNQLKVYSRSYSEMMEYGMTAFPTCCLHLANGDVFVSQSKYSFVQKAAGRN